MSKGTKNDESKFQLDLIPYQALIETAKAFMYGAKKYGRWNYKNGLEHSRLINAALRHLNQYKEGEDLDEESGNSHLGHAMASIAMLIDSIKNRPDLDDRYTPEKLKPSKLSPEELIESTLDLNQKIKEIYDPYLNPDLALLKKEPSEFGKETAKLMFSGIQCLCNREVCEKCMPKTL